VAHRSRKKHNLREPEDRVKHPGGDADAIAGSTSVEDTLAPDLRPERDAHEHRCPAGSNFCNISLNIDERTRKLIVVSVIDNLVKAPGRNAAVQEHEHHVRSGRRLQGS